MNSHFVYLVYVSIEGVFLVFSITHPVFVTLPKVGYVDMREINYKRYEIAAGQVSLVVLVGLFSNVGIFAITAFADLSAGAQTDWIVIASIIEVFFLVLAIGVFGDIAA